MNLYEMDLEGSIQNHLDLSFDFLANDLIDFSDIRICDNELDVSSEICLNATNISGLIESTANFDELLQTDFSHFVFDVQNFDEISNENSQYSSNGTSQVGQLIITDSNEGPETIQLDTFSNIINASTNSIVGIKDISCAQLEDLASPDSVDFDDSSDSAETGSFTRKMSKTRCSGGGKIDKKESNKAAAIRYRSKKIKERNNLFLECDAYANKNATLKQRIDELQTEISFIKSLLVEALIKRNAST